MITGDSQVQVLKYSGAVEALTDIPVIVNACFNDFRPSTARLISLRLLASGVTARSVGGKHMQRFYASLRRLSIAPDFAGVEDLLAHVPVAAAGDRPPLVGVILETRPHPALPTVVANVRERLGIPVQIFHGVSNAEFIRCSAIGSDIKSGTVQLSKMATDSLSAPRYNALLLSPDFWSRMIGREKILIFQTDSILCRNSDYTIDDFRSFDYIGSAWSRKRPIGMIIDGGNGGLSLRNWRMCVEAIRRFRPDRWPGGEDGFFGFHIELMGGQVGKRRACTRFGTQCTFQSRSFGAHQISNLPPKDQSAFLKYSPEAAFLLESP